MSRLQHKKGRKSTYALSLKNQNWQDVRKLIIARDRKCQHCGSVLFLEVHHKTYYENGVSIVGNELNHLNKLILLCAKCHQNEHINKQKS
jgi:5-methylcytosine-specific restriction endonuclease McrA